MERDLLRHLDQDGHIDLTLLAPSPAWFERVAINAARELAMTIYGPAAGTHRVVKRQATP